MRRTAAGELEMWMINEMEPNTRLRRYLARGGTAVFSEPGRVNAVPFFALVRQHGFTCETEAWPLEWEGSHQIAIHTIRHQGRSAPLNSTRTLLS